MPLDDPRAGRPAAPATRLANRDGPAPDDRHAGGLDVRGADGLRARADLILADLRAITHGVHVGGPVDVDRVEVLTGALRDLQSQVAGATRRRLDGADVPELHRARRSISDALFLTLDLIERLEGR
ncbi:hypothetical protein [Patulibacter minatonensis]|uniref:hypothetical protein n=1 Tax=Patulibacter minatonensis TaxID=298163 RepID=UPI00047AE7ED|nr:hypothetical protein [Patulibacter minatonensis]